jgi:hypothetical protein
MKEIANKARRDRERKEREARKQTLTTALWIVIGTWLYSKGERYSKRKSDRN